jgi:hypothetical protein
MTTPFRSPLAVRAAVLIVTLLAAPREAHAQLADSVRIAAGARVWVRMRGGAQGEWRFERATPDSLTLRRHVRGGDLIRSVPWSDAERVDTIVVGQPSGRKLLVGGVKGGLAGVMIAGLGVAFSGPCRWDAGSCPGFAFVVYGPEIIGAGILTGAYLGLRRQPSHWSTAWRAPIAPVPRDR